MYRMNVVKDSDEEDAERLSHVTTGVSNFKIEKIFRNLEKASQECIGVLKASTTCNYL